MLIIILFIIKYLFWKNKKINSMWINKYKFVRGAIYESQLTLADDAPSKTTSARLLLLSEKVSFHNILVSCFLLKKESHAVIVVNFSGFLICC
jgi:hypothetical protein